MRKPQTIRDPDLGEIEVPPAPPLSKKEWDRQLEATRERLLRSERYWKPGTIKTCHVCRKKAFEGRDDIALDLPRGDKVWLFRHLHGARCKECGAQTIEAYEQVKIEEEMGVGFQPDYEAKVSRIGRGTLGTYWPKDVERVMGMRPHRRVFIQVLSRDTALLKLKEPARRG